MSLSSSTGALCHHHSSRLIAAHPVSCHATSTCVDRQCCPCFSSKFLARVDQTPLYSQYAEYGVISFNYAFLILEVSVDYSGCKLSTSVVDLTCYVVDLTSVAPLDLGCPYYDHTLTIVPYAPVRLPNLARPVWFDQVAAPTVAE